jgi:bla regulator protein BlaR1
MNIISTILSENLINALGWTIIHSLWQGAVIALAFAVVMFLLRRFSARTRYLVGVMALMLILAISTATLLNLSHGPAQAVAPLNGGEEMAATITGTGPGGANPVSPVLFFKNYFNRHLPLVVTLWLLGILVLVLRWAGGFLYSQRVKVHRNRPLPAEWQQRLDSFSRRQDFARPIRLLESALVKIPMTIGHFKPVILFPLGLVSGLPQDQVEALLAHELAHILRKDYLVNILQHAVEILFFYHPAIHWLSAQVRCEREHCCDDIAVTLCGNSLNVAKALANLQDHRPVTPEPALAASGKRQGTYSLLTRVKRLLHPRTGGSEFTEGFIGAFILVMGLLFLVVSAKAAATLHRPGGNGNSKVVEKTAAVSEEKEKKEKQETKEEKELKKQEKLMQVQEAEMRKQEELMQIKEEEMKKQEAEMKAQEAEMRKQEELMRVNETEMKKQEAEMKAQEAEMRKQEELMRVNETEMKKQEALMRKQEAQMKAQEAEMRKQEAQMKAQEAEMRKKTELMMKVLVKELIQDHLISDPKDFEIRFQEGKFFTNGKEQPKEIFEKYKKLYEKVSGEKLGDHPSLRIENHR